MAEYKNRKQNIPEKNLGVSIGGYYIMMGTDSEQYGAGTIGIMQGKNRLVTMSYLDWQKLDAFFNQHADIFNYQLDKELGLQAVIKKRAEA